jgi:hypothetical protein
MEKCFCYPGFSGKNCEIKNKFACPLSVYIEKVNENFTNNSINLGI